MIAKESSRRSINYFFSSSYLFFNAQNIPWSGTPKDTKFYKVMVVMSPQKWSSHIFLPHRAHQSLFSLNYLAVMLWRRWKVPFIEIKMEFGRNKKKNVGWGRCLLHPTGILRHTGRHGALPAFSQQFFPSSLTSYELHSLFLHPPASWLLKHFHILGLFACSDVKGILNLVLSYDESETQN